ncbi:hypothetical protein ALP75_203696 [Pseudomonas syringae pv. actinidiae]|nr:hypothetical protein ALP75_203696 [Pseudomonas syringae pv. actinidiae]
MLIQHFAGVLEVQLVSAIDTPRQRTGPVQIITRHGVFRRAGFQHLEFVDLLVELLARLWWQGLAFQALLELLDVGAAVVLAQPQLLLNDLELFFKEELTLMLADLAVHLGRDLFLQTCDFDFLAQHRQDFLHAPEHRHTVEHFLQLDAGGRSQGRSEVSEWRRIVGAEAVEVILQLFAVQRVEWQELLDRVDQGHAVGLHFIGRVIGLLRVLDFHQIRRAMMLEPGADTHTAQPLRDKL